MYFKEKARRGEVRPGQALCANTAALRVGCAAVLKFALKKEVKKSKNARCLGEWLPLSVWVARGWPADVIERHEKKTDAAKGVLYRIGVEQDIDEVVEMTVEQRLRELMPKTKCVKETPETLRNMPSADRDAQDPLFKENADRDAQDDSESSSSSSSSSSSVKTKKKKKGNGSKNKKQIKIERKAKLAAQRQKDLEKKRKAEEKRTVAEERRQSLLRRKAEKEAEAKATADAKKAKVAALNAAAKVKTEATKVLAKLAGPMADIETLLERCKSENVAPLMTLKVENCLKSLSAMYDEAKGKFADRAPTPLSFDMPTLNKIVSECKSIQKSRNEIGQADA